MLLLTWTAESSFYVPTIDFFFNLTDKSIVLSADIVTHSYLTVQLSFLMFAFWRKNIHFHHLDNFKHYPLLKLQYSRFWQPITCLRFEARSLNLCLVLSYITFSYVVSLVSRLNNLSSNHKFPYNDTKSLLFIDVASVFLDLVNLFFILDGASWTVYCSAVLSRSTVSIFRL